MQSTAPPRIAVPKFVVVVTAIFAAAIPTFVGALGWFSPANAPLFVEGAHDLTLSWGARSLGLAAAGWIALVLIRDARGYVVALGANAIREILDLIDLLFRSHETSSGLYVMLPISSASLTAAFVLSLLAVRRAQSHAATAV